jgi:proline-specific peptidase
MSELNPAVYNYMQGPSEFTITGTLKSYDATTTLKDISVPTLFVVGQYDEATPETAKYFQSLVPRAELTIVENAAHLAMIDQPDHYVQTLRDFLRRADR